MILIHVQRFKTQDRWDMWCNEPIALTVLVFAAESLHRLSLIVPALRFYILYFSPLWIALHFD